MFNAINRDLIVLLVLIILFAFITLILIEAVIEEKKFRIKIRRYLKTYKPTLEARATLIRQECSEGIANIMIDGERRQYEELCRKYKVSY